MGTARRLHPATQSELKVEVIDIFKF